MAGRRTRRLCLLAGLAVLAATWAGPLPRLAANSFASHMLMHMGVVAVAAPLLAAGLAHGACDPAARWPHLFPALPASALEFVVVWGWHAPALHHAARHSGAMLMLEQGSFLAVGLLVWMAALGGNRASRNRTGAGIAALLMTSMHMTLLGVLLALAGRPLYGHHGPAAFGLAPLADQQLGGVLMLVFGGVSYLTGALVLLAGLLRRRHGQAPREVVADA